MDIILPLVSTPTPSHLDDALQLRSISHDLQPPIGPPLFSQNFWIHAVRAAGGYQLETAPNSMAEEHLLAPLTKKGAWLMTILISSHLCINDKAIRIAVCLLPGALFCKPHICHHCGIYSGGSVRNPWS